MNGNAITPDEVHEVMTLWAKGLMYKEIGEKVGRSYKSIECIVLRNRNIWSRDFNFPQIMRAKRFGAL